MEIKLVTNKILVQPDSSGSSFSLETKKYDRKSIGVVKAVGDNAKGVSEGDRVIYNDSNSIDFTLEGTSYSIIEPDAIAATIIEEDK